MPPQTPRWIKNFLLLLVVGSAVGTLHGQVQQPPTIVPFSLTSTGTYFQSFDTSESVPNGPGLLNQGTSGNTPPGWGFVETGTLANGLYTANDGSLATADTYSYGQGTNNERAFGTLRDDNLTSSIGAQFVNNTGSVITNITITFTGEQWRVGGSTNTDRLDFVYSTNATAGSLTLGTFTAFDALDFSSLVTSSTAGPLIGDNFPNRVVISAVIGGLNIPVGGTFTMRWDDFNVSGADDGLAIDEFNLTPVPEPGTWAGAALAAAVLGYPLFGRRKKQRA